MDESIKKPNLGFLHIPKSAGASLNESIFSALGLEAFHVTRVMSREAATELKNPGRTIIKGSLAHTLARNMPYVPGHITFSDLRSLNRSFIFTVLRDPRKRVVSLFTYMQKRANSPKVVHKFPQLKKFAHMGFGEFMEHRRPVNEVATQMLSDMEGFAEISGKQTWNDWGQEFSEFVEHGLKRFDVIYSCPNQAVLDDLHSRGFIPQTSELWKNQSDNNINFGELGSRHEFLDVLNRATWQDTLVYQTAQKVFPESMRVSMASDAEILEEVENRFGISFSGA